MPSRPKQRRLKYRASKVFRESLNVTGITKLFYMMMEFRARLELCTYFGAHDCC